MMFVFGIDKLCQQSAKEQIEPSECGVKVCSWEPRPSEFEMREVGSDFLYPQRERATTRKRKGVMAQGHLVVHFPMPFEHCFCLAA